jgi:8-oxo-dGTP diphosphatase
MIQYKIPKVTVAAIVVFDKSLYVFTKRKNPPFKDYWCLPGGHVEKDESLKTAIVREVFEETGLRTKVTEKLSVYHEEGIQDNVAYNYDATLFVVEPLDKNFNMQESEVTEMVLLSRSNIPKNLAFTHNKMLNEYFSKWRLLRNVFRRRNSSS